MHFAHNFFNAVFIGFQPSTIPIYPIFLFDHAPMALSLHSVRKLLQPLRFGCAVLRLVPTLTMHVLQNTMPTLATVYVGKHGIARLLITPQNPIKIKLWHLGSKPSVVTPGVR